MYIPTAYAWDDAQEIAEFVRRRGFGTVVTRSLEATEVPLLWREEAGRRYLCGHLAKANPMAAGLDGEPVLVLFAGPDGYISPRWYETLDVPTWNYVTVHAHGTFRVSGPADAWQDLVDLVRRHETDARFAALLEKPQVRAQASAVVPFRIEIASLEGKRKLSQNRSEASQAGVLEGLRLQGDPLSHLLSAAMSGGRQSR